jgi:hypothetical protein
VVLFPVHIHFSKFHLQCGTLNSIPGTFAPEPPMKYKPQLENLKSKIANLKSKIEAGFESELNGFLPDGGGVELESFPARTAVNLPFFEINQPASNIPQAPAYRLAAVIPITTTALPGSFIPGDHTLGRIRT